MSATHEDRNASLSPGVAIKAPCRVATTAAITLSGEQTIDAVACVTGDRVLVKNQASSIDNGIYGISTGTWAREPDFDGNRDVVTGTFVFITSGATNAGAFYECTTTGTVVFGTSNITFAVGALGPIALPLNLSNTNFTQAGTGAVARTGQAKERDVVALADFDTSGHYDTAAAALGSTGKYSFGGNINFPGASQLRGITWNSSDIQLYRQGAGRLAIVLTPDGTIDQAIDVATTITTGQGSSRLRLWAYNVDAQADQSYFEITNSRDVGSEGMYIASRISGAGTYRSMFFQVSGATQLKLPTFANAVNYFEIFGSATAVGRPTFRVNGSDTNIGMLFSGKGTTDFLFQYDALGTPTNAFQVIPGAGGRWLTISNSATNPVLDATAGAIKLSSGTADIQWGKANVALGGGAAPTVGTIGGSGPAAAGQRNWLRFIESDGTASFIPVWR